MDENRFTEIAAKTLEKAVTEANERANPQVEIPHLLFAMIKLNGPAKEIISGNEEAGIIGWVNRLPTVDGGNTQPNVANEVRQAIRLGVEESRKRGDEYVPQEMLLWGIVNLGNTEVDSILNKEIILQKIEEMRKNKRVTSENAESNYKALEKYTTDLTELAKKGKIDPVIGRDSEIRRVMQVLSRRTKNNPVLVGDPGVGKTAIVEGLANRIIAGDVPESLKGKKLLSLEMSSIVAGAKFRGEFEERMRTIIDEIVKSEGKIILFIDELHTIVGAGGAEGSVDASNMMKPNLARGTLRVIGATTINEYRKYIEKDSALERRFQPVTVEEPTIEDAIAIMRGLKEKYELHHGIKITDLALVASVKLSTRYIRDRFLPDKAIDLIDEAASGLRIQMESSPTQIDSMQRKIRQLEIEEKALSKESSENTKIRLEEVKKELANLNEKFREIKTKWEKQKELLTAIQKNREEIDKLKYELETAERKVELDKAAEIKYGRIPKAQEELKKAEGEWNKISVEDQIIKTEVSEDEVASVVSRWTGIPVNRLLKSETNKLKNLEKLMEEKVVGQRKAVEAVANAIRRSKMHLGEANKPIATFLFLGPTGVGKTETAKALASELFNDEKAMVRIDCSEYSESHSVARLIGSPPGYVGYDEGGQLTEAVRRHPYTVVLLDEVEKANPQIFNVFLQLFDEGRLTDGKGRTVDFTNTVIIMTSNIEEENLAKTFRPEFLNRIDQIIKFEELSEKMLRGIVEIQIKKVIERLKEQDIILTVTDKAKEYLSKNGYDKAFGARPLKRLIQNEVLDKVAMVMLDKEDDSEGAILVDEKAGKITVSLMD